MEEVKLVKISQRPAKRYAWPFPHPQYSSRTAVQNVCAERPDAPKSSHVNHVQNGELPIFADRNNSSDLLSLLQSMSTTRLLQTRSLTISFLCSAEIDALKNALVGEIDDLKRRISQLEKLEGKRREYPSSGNSEREEEGGTEAATTLEFMALGLDRRLESQGQSKKFDAGPTTPSSSASPSSSSAKQPDVTSGSSRSHLLKESRLPLPENISNALLPQEVAISVFKFHTTNVYWQHACIYVKDFEAQVEEFYKLAKNGKCDKVDGSWIALFFVLQAISVHQMTDEYAEACNLGSVSKLHHPLSPQKNTY